MQSIIIAPYYNEKDNEKDNEKGNEKDNDKNANKLWHNSLST